MKCRVVARPDVFYAYLCYFCSRLGQSLYCVRLDGSFYSVGSVQFHYHKLFPDIDTLYSRRIFLSFRYSQTNEWIVCCLSMAEYLVSGVWVGVHVHDLG